MRFARFALQLRSAPDTAPWKTVFAALFACSWCGNQFSPLLTMYRADGYSALAVNVFLGVYVLGLVPALLLGGSLSDSRGRRPLMLVALLSSVVASSCLALGVFGPAGLCCGRFFSGIAVGLSIAVGSSWLQELSRPPFERRESPARGARRASVAFALGSALGALVAGAIAQLTALGAVLPFLIQIAVAAPCIPLLLRAPETAKRSTRRARAALPLGDRRFRTLVFVVGPWTFAAAAIGYGYLPVLLAGSTSGWDVAYATLLTVTALGTAALVQPLVVRFVIANPGRRLALAPAIFAIGLLLAAAAESLGSPVLGVFANLVLGAGIGAALVCGMVESRALANRGNLAAVTGAFYASAYSGFLLPVPMAALTPPLTSFGLLVGLAALCAFCGLRASVTERSVSVAPLPDPSSP